MYEECREPDEMPQMRLDNRLGHSPVPLRLRQHAPNQTCRRARDQCRSSPGGETHSIGLNDHECGNHRHLDRLRSRAYCSRNGVPLFLDDRRFNWGEQRGKSDSDVADVALSYRWSITPGRRFFFFGYEGGLPARVGSLLRLGRYTAKWRPTYRDIRFWRTVGQGTAAFEVFEAALMLISANAASGEEELDGLRFGEADSSGIVFAVGNRPK